MFPLSTREWAMGDGSRLRDCTPCMNDRSCLGLGEVPLFRAAAAARVPFFDRQRKEAKKADPDGSARCAGARACAGRADGHPWPAARERDLGLCILHGPDRPARNIPMRVFGSLSCLTPRAHTSCFSRAVPPLPKGD
ncbi:MAG: hypothetical protein ACYC97_08580 [Metallibacterium sp.]